MRQSARIPTVTATFAQQNLIVALAVFGLCMANNARAVTYKATLLRSTDYPGSEAYGVSGASQAGWGAGPATGSRYHAMLWNGTAASAVDLHPAGATESLVRGVSGGSQVGYGTGIGGAIGGTPHALLWNGTAESAVDLNPPGYAESSASGVSGASQVGSGIRTTALHALLWNGTAASVVDLHPSRFSYSSAFGVSGASQVGLGSPAGSSGHQHALLWSGTAASVVDLHPTGFSDSEAKAVSGASQVGSGYPTNSSSRHALLWNGTASSVVDLHPAGFDFSEASGIAGASQVGFGLTTSGNAHALLWKGTAASVVDLHPFLTALDPTIYSSNAQAIADNGSIVGYASGLYYTSAVLWTPVPEPASLTLLAAGLLGLTSYRQRKVICR